MPSKQTSPVVFVVLALVVLFVLAALPLASRCAAENAAPLGPPRSHGSSNEQEKEQNMTITVNLRYTGKNGAARKFAEEMTSGGTLAAIRAEPGNLRYEYYQSLEDPETVLLIDSWTDQAAIDAHHASPMMAVIAALREKYDLRVTAERFTSAEMPKSDEKFIKTDAFSRNETGHH
ncbi:MAG: antibiotic biosynthesis monooxygenase [Thermoguttaceae bacterium]|nr:antibiotic biosynthesis monooxygenase [Thermoguttaceae bacterium]MBR2586165.1 antibiotic biosynthesis monooxygenase [Thermoguttaceae bacterium]